MVATSKLNLKKAQSMSLQEFNKFKKQVQFIVDHPHEYLRAGQRVSNLLRQYYDNIADEILGTEVDPFYVDSRISNLLNYINEFHVR